MQQINYKNIRIKISNNKRDNKTTIHCSRVEHKMYFKI